MKTETIGAFDAKTHFSELLEKARRGMVFIVTKHGKPVAQLGPSEEGASGPVFGSARGRVHMREDFDDPPVGFQPYPHHGRYPFDDESANGLSDSRPQFVNEKAAVQAGIWGPCKGAPHDHQRVPP